MRCLRDRCYCDWDSCQEGVRRSIWRVKLKETSHSLVPYLVSDVLAHLLALLLHFAVLLLATLLRLLDGLEPLALGLLVLLLRVAVLAVAAESCCKNRKRSLNYSIDSVEFNISSLRRSIF